MCVFVVTISEEQIINKQLDSFEVHMSTKNCKERDPIDFEQPLSVLRRKGIVIVFYGSYLLLRCIRWKNW